MQWLVVIQTINKVYVLKSKSTLCRLANNRSWESFEGAQSLDLQGTAVLSNDEYFTLQLKAYTPFEKSVTIYQSIRCAVTEVTTVQHGCANVKTTILGVSPKLRK